MRLRDIVCQESLVKFFSRNFKHFDKTTGDLIVSPAILTGCRPSKFSLHIIVDDVRWTVPHYAAIWHGVRTCLWTFIQNGHE
jgi:hypothetical protein